MTFSEYVLSFFCVCVVRVADSDITSKQGHSLSLKFAGFNHLKNIMESKRHIAVSKSAI